MWFYYHQDVRDLWRPNGGGSGLTYRLLGVWIRRLPPESATKTAIRDALGDAALVELAKEEKTSHGPWSRSDYLLAAVIDRLGALHSGLYRAQGADIKYPDPWPRPGVAAARTRKLTDEARAYLQRLRDDHARLHGTD